MSEVPTSQTENYGVGFETAKHSVQFQACGAEVSFWGKRQCGRRTSIERTVGPWMDVSLPPMLVQDACFLHVCKLYTAQALVAELAR